MRFRAKRELLAQIAPRYRDAAGAHKSRILDEFVAATGYARKYTIRLLSDPVPPPVHVICRPRARRYGRDVQEALAVAWAAANYVCTKRLVPFLPELVASLERHGHLSLSDGARSQLLQRPSVTGTTTRRRSASTCGSPEWSGALGEAGFMGYAHPLHALIYSMATTAPTG
jgi:hypothetical protein